MYIEVHFSSESFDGQKPVKTLCVFLHNLELLFS